MSCGDTSHTAYQHVILWFSGIVGWSGPDRHYAYAYARLVLPTCFAHSWLAGVSFANFSWTECGYARSLRRLKQHQLDKLSLLFWCVGKNDSCSAHSSHVKLAPTKWRTSNLLLQGLLWCDMVKTWWDISCCMRWSCFVEVISNRQKPYGYLSIA